MDITKAIQPKSDQLNADDLAQPVTITITDVRQGNAEQPVHIVTDVYGDRRPWKPAKTMLRLMAQHWGLDTKDWHGRRVTLFRDPTVEFGGDTVGGIRIAAMSGINRAFTDNVTIKRGKRSKVKVEQLPDTAPQQQHDLADRIYVAGRWQTGTGALIESVDPSNGRVFATLHGATVPFLSPGRCSTFARAMC